MLLSVFDLPLWNLAWWQYVLITLGMTHVTIAAVTIFLHRHQAHRALDLHPAVSHFFRLWLWLTTGMVTKAWAAIHRKHHAKCETAEDPHSPQVMGLKKVLLEGAELYRAEAKNPATLEKYGHGTPDDWLERKLYTPHSGKGIVLMLLANVALFGPIGVTMWAVQMAWIPFFAAGIINGVGHYWGYRNFECEDASTNIVPWGILIGGEELHNNHHAYGTSARLSNKWYEFDIGWLYIRTLEMIGLAKVRRTAPVVRWQTARPMVDLGVLQSVITHRYDVMTRYAKLMNKQVKDHLPQGVNVSKLREWLHLEPAALKQEQRAEVEKALARNDVLAKLYQMRQELAEVWGRSTLSKEQLVSMLQDWCQRAEASGIEALREFSLRLKSYA
jgi:stearoyl-CoA desaturase (delta-9 desaturase)